MEEKDCMKEEENNTRKKENRKKQTDEVIKMDKGKEQRIWKNI